MDSEPGRQYERERQQKHNRHRARQSRIGFKVVAHLSLPLSCIHAYLQ